MSREEAKSCIGTIEMLKILAYNIHGVMDVIDADNCKKIIKVLEKEPVLDKIRSEIDNHCSDNRDRNDGLYIAMKIIDKYKAESEELKPKRRMYKGCENCKNYQNRICMMTGDELAMVCEEWEAKDEQG